MTFNPADAIDRQPWRRARTWERTAPHEYIIRTQVADDEWFDAFVRFIRQHGEVRAFGRKMYVHWFAEDGFYYWTMGWPVDETTVINRALQSNNQARSVDRREGLIWSSPDGSIPEGVPQ